MENGNQPLQVNGKGVPLLPGESLDRRVLDKVILALEARLAEHVTGVDRRLAEMDAQIGLELQSLAKQGAGRDGALAEAITQAETRLSAQVEEVRQHGAGRIAALDERLSTLQETLPARLRDIVEAVRQSLEARLELAAGEIEQRVEERTMESRGRQAEPLRRAVEQLESKLETLREELPPRIREIVEALESAVNTRISAAQQEASGQAAAIRQGLEEDLQRQAAAADALDRKLTAFQQELPARFKAIVDAVQESLEARMAAGREAELERARQHSSAIEARIETLERNLLRSSGEAVEEAAGRVWGAVKSRLEQQGASIGPVSGESGSIAGLRQKSTSAEQTVLDLIAGIGDLFERPARPLADVADSAPSAAAAPAGPGPETPAVAEEGPDEAVAATLFRPKEPARKWRIPSLSSFFSL